MANHQSQFIIQYGYRKEKVVCRVFNERWTHDYMLIENYGKSLCLVCNTTIAALKEYNLRRHYSALNQQQ